MRQIGHLVIKICSIEKKEIIMNVKKRNFLKALAFFPAILMPGGAKSQMMTVPVQGRILSNSGPIPGLMVILVHQYMGRSVPVVSDNSGYFIWNAIPVRSEPFVLEIYWGQNLVYRAPIMITGPTYLPPIYL
jgi:hypothetical protein